MPFETEAYKRLEAAHVVEFEEGRGIVFAGAYYTPDPILKAIRDVMGEIDVDPASCKVAQRRIQALKFYDKTNSGLENDWVGRVYLNTDYDLLESGLFMVKADEEWKNGNMTECIIHFPTDKTWHRLFHWVLELFQAYCFVIGKVKWTPAWVGYEKEMEEVGEKLGFFIDEAGLSMAKRPSGGEPYTIHGSLFAYLGPNIERFVEVFSEIGTVLRQAPGV